MSATEDSKAVAKNIQKIWETKIIPSIYALAHKVALDAVEKMKRTHKWENQTQMAQNFLFGESFLQNKDVGFFVAHGIEYGDYLELANDRKYEILRPAIEEFGEKYIVEIRRIISA